MADDAGSRRAGETHEPRVDDPAHDGQRADAGRDGPAGEQVDAGTLSESLPDQLVGEAEEEDDGAVAGSFAPDLDVTPGTPRLENVVFVALGVYAAALAVGRMFVGASMYTPATLGALTVGVVAGTALLYGFFVGSNPDT